MINKFKHRKILDQNVMDLLVSLDFYKTQSYEIEIFNSFFT
jgi:hypothetical protein